MTSFNELQGQPTRHRSRAWIYYSILTLLAIVAAVASSPAALFPAALFALYAVYLFRGGRIVIWFW